MRTYKIGVVWQQYGYVEVEAENDFEFFKKRLI